MDITAVEESTSIPQLRITVEAEIDNDHGGSASKFVVNFGYWSPGAADGPELNAWHIERTVKENELMPGEFDALAEMRALADKEADARWGNSNILG